VIGALSAVYLESGKDVGGVVVEPEQHGADHVADGEVGQQAMMNGPRSSYEAERRQCEAVEQQTADRQSRIRHETRAEVDWQSVCTAQVGLCCRRWPPIQLRGDTDVDRQYVAAFHPVTEHCSLS